jgi:hypothetical protein
MCPAGPLDPLGAPTRQRQEGGDGLRADDDRRPVGDGIPLKLPFRRMKARRMQPGAPVGRGGTNALRSRLRRQSALCSLHNEPGSPAREPVAGTIALRECPRLVKSRVMDETSGGPKGRSCPAPARATTSAICVPTGCWRSRRARGAAPPRRALVPDRVPQGAGPRQRLRPARLPRRTGVAPLELPEGFIRAALATTAA